MKKLSYIIATSFLIFGFASCDIIEEPYLKENNESSEHLPLSAEDTLNWINEKVVLLEDYTGVRCTNCPLAAEEALEIQEQNEHRVVVLGVHAGDLSSVPPNGPFIDFTTEEGNAWYTYFQFGSNPIGAVNRQSTGGTYAYQYSTWTGAVAEALDGEPNVRLLLAKDYNEETRELRVSAYSKFLAEFSDTYSLTVCIMEDSIVGMQVTPQGNNPDYIHRHVFRTTMNGTWGTELNTEVIAPNEEIVKSYSIILDEAYNADQCYIIAYVSNSETKEILQVVEKKIK